MQNNSEITKALLLRILSSASGAVGFTSLIYTFTIAQTSFYYALATLFLGGLFINLSFFFKSRYALIQNKLLTYNTDISMTGYLIDSSYSLLIFILAPISIILITGGSAFLSVAFYLVFVYMSLGLRLKIRNLNWSLILLMLFILLITYEILEENLQAISAVFTLMFARQAVIGTDASQSPTIFNLASVSSLFQNFGVSEKIVAKENINNNSIWLAGENTQIIQNNQNYFEIKTQELKKDWTLSSITHLISNLLKAQDLNLDIIKITQEGPLVTIKIKSEEKLEFIDNDDFNILKNISLKNYKQTFNANDLINDFFIDIESHYKKAYSKAFRHIEFKSIEKIGNFIDKNIKLINKEKIEFYYLCANTINQETLLSHKGKEFCLCFKDTLIKPIGYPLFGQLRDRIQEDYDNTCCNYSTRDAIYKLSLLRNKLDKFRIKEAINIIDNINLAD